eukprot:1040711-Amorphochlora_amoeboformis.AAC.1
MHQQHIQCINNTSNASTTHPVHQQHIQCIYNTHNASTTHAVVDTYVEADNIGEIVPGNPRDYTPAWYGYG